MTEPNYYELLGVMRNAPPEVIRGAYKALAQKYHPDKNAGDAEAARMMTALNRAALTLLNAEKRQAYDESLNGQAAASPEPPEAPEPDTVTPNPSTEAMEEPAPKPVNWFKGWRIIASILISFLAVKLLGILGYLVGVLVFAFLLKKRGPGIALAAGVATGAVVAVLYSAFVMRWVNSTNDAKAPATTFQFDPSTAHPTSSTAQIDEEKKNNDARRHAEYVEAVTAIQRRIAAGEIPLIQAHATLLTIDGISFASIPRHVLESTQTWWRDGDAIYIYLKNITGLPLSGLRIAFSEMSCEVQGRSNIFSVDFDRTLQPDEIAVAAVERVRYFQTQRLTNCLTITAANYVGDVPAIPAPSGGKAAAIRPKEQDRRNDALRAQAIDNAAEALSRRNTGPYGR